jgi:type VI secretion system secreted protein Hcp
MALNAYLTFTGETNGKVNGSVTQAGREDTMEVYGFSHEVVCPRDAASGLPTGKRQHKPVNVTKPVDKATPISMNVLTNNENITEWRLDFYKPSRAGKEFQYYTIELVNASLAGIRSEMLNNKYPENMKHEVREHLSFCYQKIVWTWQDGGITAEDDWETPLSG